MSKALLIIILSYSLPSASAGNCNVNNCLAGYGNEAFDANDPTVGYHHCPNSDWSWINKCQFTSNINVCDAPTTWPDGSALPDWAYAEDNTTPPHVVIRSFRDLNECNHDVLDCPTCTFIMEPGSIVFNSCQWCRPVDNWFDVCWLPYIITRDAEGDPICTPFDPVNMGYFDADSSDGHMSYGTAAEAGFLTKAETRSVKVGAPSKEFSSFDDPELGGDEDLLLFIVVGVVAFAGLVCCYCCVCKKNGSSKTSDA